MNAFVSPPSPQKLAALLRDIGPLPLSGQAWPNRVCILTWIGLAVLGLQVVATAIRAPAETVGAPMCLMVALCFLTLLALAWRMQTSITTIDEKGLRQTWLMRREVAWENILTARFVPLLFTKRLIVFTRSGKLMVFHGGTRELHAAFTKITLTYRRKLRAGA